MRVMNDIGYDKLHENMYSPHKECAMEFVQTPTIEDLIEFIKAIDEYFVAGTTVINTVHGKNDVAETRARLKLTDNNSRIFIRTGFTDTIGGEFKFYPVSISLFYGTPFLNLMMEPDVEDYEYFKKGEKYEEELLYRLLANCEKTMHERRAVTIYKESLREMLD